MGAAIRAVSDTFTLIRHNPIILGLGWFAFVAFSIANLVLGIIPLIGNLLSFLLFPAVIAGLLAMVYAGRNGEASAGSFGHGISNYYPRLLGAYFLAGIPFVLLVVGSTVAMAFAVPMGSPSRGAGVGASGPAAAAGLGMTFLLAFFAVGLLVGALWMVFQFFGVAIVVEDAGVIESFKTSLSLFTSDPLSVIGFTVLRVLVAGAALVGSIGVLSVLGFGAAEIATGSDPLATGGALTVVMLLYVFVLLPVWRVLTRTYQVAYFNRRRAAAS